MQKNKTSEIQKNTKIKTNHIKYLPIPTYSKETKKTTIKTKYLLQIFSIPLKQNKKL